MKVLFVICFVVVICMIIANIIWDIALTERERKCKADLLDLSIKWGKLRSREAAVEKVDKTLQDKELELNQRENELTAKAEELAKKAKELEDAAVALVPDVPDVIEPADEPQKIAFGTTEKKRCPRCGKDMEMKTDVCYTSIPPQYKYTCPECGYEEIDTCPPTHNLVGTDKKPVKKAKKGGKK